MELYETLPIVPLRDVVVFPHMMMPFVIGRPSSTRALEHALVKDKRIFLAAQHDAAVDDPQPTDIYTMGCVANIVQSLKLPDGNIKVLVEGIERARAVEWKEDKGFYRVVVKVIPKPKEAGVDAESTMTRVVSLFEQYVKLSNNLHYDAMIAAVRVDDPGKLADTIAAHLAGRRRREAEPARDHLADRTPQPHRRHPRSRGRQAPGRSPHPVARQEADGEGAEGVLPQREDEGDPEGTGPQGREGQRDRRAEEEDRTVEDAGRGRGEGDPGAEAARVDAADVGGSDRLAQLPRLADRRALAQEDQGEPRPQARRGRSSTRTTTASRRSRTASSSSSPSARWSRSRRRRSSPSPALRASARPRSPSRSRAR